MPRRIVNGTVFYFGPFYELLQEAATHLMFRYLCIKAQTTNLSFRWSTCDAKRRQPKRPSSTTEWTQNDTLHGRYRIVEPPDHTWGIQLPNGSWSGIIGMAQRRVSPLTSVWNEQNVGHSALCPEHLFLFRRLTSVSDPWRFPQTDSQPLIFFAQSHKKVLRCSWNRPAASQRQRWWL